LSAADEDSDWMLLLAVTVGATALAFAIGVLAWALS
jgi:hypothetical protein